MSTKTKKRTPVLESVMTRTGGGDEVEGWFRWFAYCERHPMVRLAARLVRLY